MEGGSGGEGGGESGGEGGGESGGEGRYLKHDGTLCCINESAIRYCL